MSVCTHDPSDYRPPELQLIVHQFGTVVACQTLRLALRMTHIALEDPDDE